MVFDFKPIKKSISNRFAFITLPISDVHDTTMVLGTVVDNLTREVMLMGLLGRFGSTPFLVGGRYPWGHTQKVIELSTKNNKLHIYMLVSEILFVLIVKEVEEMSVSDVENFQSLVQVPNTCLRWFHKNVNKSLFSKNKKTTQKWKCIDAWFLHYKYTCVYHSFKLFVCHSQMDWKIPGDLWGKIKPDSQGGYRVFHSLSHKGWVENDLPEDNLSLISKTWKICVEIPLGMCGKYLQDSLGNPNKRKLRKWG